ncbi:acyl-CoA dehydrogenase family protein [Sneathiella sp. CAU 1612]|uniref:Acyl-CoA dehydrogenase family protein n=1 Tax=Sneathiella sedimenti TaxID=2816034 RepID=A0ABS3F3F7_9PROT|nr:acyl-CoA dehydrogenase family protein [Sneathiella sedimenti]MBO0332636.1 acyl-CoA dehydrogenase family protein [Sneathiella sedimenti]
MQFSEEHIALKNTVTRIIDEHINPNVDAWEKEGMFPAHEVMKRMADAGLLGIGKPVQYGGLDLDFSYEMVFAEALGSIRANGVSTSIGVQTTMCTPALTQFGSEELKQEFLIPTIAGDLVGCIGVSEESAGSDVANTRTFAKRDGDDYIINGSKMWITNGVQGDWICLLVNTSQEGGPHRNKSLIIVPLKTKGVSVARKLDKLGLHCSDTAQLFFDDVRVPARNLIGEENKGFTYQMQQFQEERLFVAARALRGMEMAIEDTIEYTGQRKAFNGTILDNQVVYHKMAEMQSEIEAARALLYRTTEQYVSGEDVTKLASMTKFMMGTLANKIPSACLQYWGGQGFMSENWISRAYRDLRLTGIGGGANEIMLEIIAKQMGIHPGKRN